MGLGDWISSPFGTGNYNVAQGMPGFQGQGTQDLIGTNADAQHSMWRQQAFTDALTAGGGLNTAQQGIMNQQQALANQYGQIAAGGGPNPAQAQLAQNTGQNMQQQAALMAGARGAQSNPGLIARQAGQVGAQAQQQSVGQAATMGAQQQLSAMQQMAAQQGQMANLATAGVGQQQTALSQLGQQNLARQQLAQQAITSQNQQQVQAQLGQAQLAGQGMQNTSNLLGGILGGIGGAFALAGGGLAGDPTQIQQQSAQNLAHPMVAHTQGDNASPQDDSPKFGNTEDPLYQGAQKFGQALTGGIGKAMSSGITSLAMAGGMASGGTARPPVDVALSPGEKVFTPTQAQEAAHGAHIEGKKVPGKAKVPGDSTVNDTFRTKLKSGDVVVPRSHAEDPKKTAEFLNNLLGFNLHHRRKTA